MAVITGGGIMDGVTPAGISAAGGTDITATIIGAMPFRFSRLA
jgi:hypothetical protein